MKKNKSKQPSGTDSVTESKNLILAAKAAIEQCAKRIVSGGRTLDSGVALLIAANSQFAKTSQVPLEERVLFRGGYVC